MPAPTVPLRSSTNALEEPIERQHQSRRAAGRRARATGTTPAHRREVPEDEDDFSLSRSGPMTVEELDLAPMVDVAFQLVLFFMVAAPDGALQDARDPQADAPSRHRRPSPRVGRARSTIFKEDYILVEIDASGAMKIDREPVAADMNDPGGAAADGPRGNPPQGDAALGRLCDDRTAMRCWPTTRPTRSAWAS